MATLVFLLVVPAIYFIVFRYPGVACGLVLASFAIEQYAQATVPVTAAVSPLCNYLTAGAVGVALISQAHRLGFGVFRLHLPGVLVLSLLVYCYATLLWALFPSTTEKLLRMNVPLLVVFVGLTPLVIQSVGDVEHAILGLIIGSCLALLGLIVFGHWEGRSVVLLNGEMSNPLALTQAAGSLLVAASLTDVLRKFTSNLWPLAASVIGFTVLLAFLRTGSRGQIVAASSITLLFSSMRRGRWWVPLFSLGLAGTLAAGFMDAEVQQHAARWNPAHLERDTDQGRIGEAEILLRYWTNSSPFRVWLGLGNGAAQDPRLLNGYPHLVPAEVLAEEGIIGFGIYCAAILAGAAFYIRGQASSAMEHRNLVLAAAALCGYEFLLTLKQGSLFGGATFLLLLVLAGPLSRNPPTSHPAGSHERSSR